MRARPRFTPVEQVWRAPVRRRLVQHVHHRHVSSTTLQVRVAVDARLTSVSSAIHLHAAQPGARVGATASPAPLALVLRDRVAPGAPPGLRHQPALRAAPPTADPRRPQVPAPLTAVPRPAVAAPPPVPLVHRIAAPEPGVAPGPVSARPVPAGARPAAGTVDVGPAPVPGAPSLTTADLPGVIDHVVREIDRRVVAARERRGWTS